jgi:hypothetical protein
MRTSLAIVVGCMVLAALAATAVASDEDVSLKVQALRDALSGGADAHETWVAYAAARKALGALPEPSDYETPPNPAKQAFDGLVRDAATKLEPDAAKALDALESITADEKAPWKDKWEAYKAAKEALEDAAGQRPSIAGGQGPALDYYVLIRKQVADAVRRDGLSFAGWLMGFFGAVLLWGGFAFCVRIARKSGKEQAAEGNSAA